MRKGGGRIITAPDIDDIDPSLTPSLVGYWKCNDGAGDIIKDYSGNGYDLTIRPTDFPDSTPIPTDEQRAQAAESRWGEHPGYFSPGFSYGAMIDIADAPLLSTGSNQVVFGCELQYNDREGGVFLSEGDTYSAADFDLGTYWAGSDSSSLFNNHFAPAKGFNLWAVSLLGDLQNQDFGVRVDDSVLPQVSSAAMYFTAGEVGGYAAYHDVMKNRPFSMVGGYDPSVALHRAFKVGTDPLYFSSVTTGLPASLPVQELDGVEMFGLRAQNRYPPRCGIKNFYVWSASDLPFLEEGVQWLAANPGKIPPWWIGR